MKLNGFPYPKCLIEYLVNAPESTKNELSLRPDRLTLSTHLVQQSILNFKSRSQRLFESVSFLAFFFFSCLRSAINVCIIWCRFLSFLVLFLSVVS